MDVAHAIQEIFHSAYLSEEFMSHYDSLSAIVGIVQEEVDPNRTFVRVSLRPEFITRDGQELDFVVESGGEQRDVLFKASVPLSGGSSRLDFFGDRVVRCEGVDDMEWEIVRFISMPEVSGRLALLKLLAGRREEDIRSRGIG